MESQLKKTSPLSAVSLTVQSPVLLSLPVRSSLVLRVNLCELQCSTHYLLKKSVEQLNSTLEM